MPGGTRSGRREGWGGEEEEEGGESTLTAAQTRRATPGTSGRFIPGSSETRSRFRFRPLHAPTPALGGHEYAIRRGAWPEGSRVGVGGALLWRRAGGLRGRPASPLRGGGSVPPEGGAVYGGRQVYGHFCCAEGRRAWRLLRRGAGSRESLSDRPPAGLALGSPEKPHELCFCSSTVLFYYLSNHQLPHHRHWAGHRPSLLHIPNVLPLL